MTAEPLPTPEPLDERIIRPSKLRSTPDVARLVAAWDQEFPQIIQRLPMYRAMESFTAQQVRATKDSLIFDLVNTARMVGFAIGTGMVEKLPPICLFQAWLLGLMDLEILADRCSKGLDSDSDAEKLILSVRNVAKLLRITLSLITTTGSLEEPQQPTERESR